MTDHRIERLSAWYQPIVDLNTGKVAGCEVLSRIVAADGSAVTIPCPGEGGFHVLVAGASGGGKSSTVTTIIAELAHRANNELWLLDPDIRTLEAYSFSDGHWLLEGTWKDDDQVRTAPFAEVVLHLDDLWVPTAHSAV